MKNVNNRAIVYALAVPIFLFYVLALTGCVSNSSGIPNLYLLEMNGQNLSALNGGDTRLRLGYFGICAGNQTTNCGPTTGQSADQIIASLSAPNNGANKAMFTYALALQSSVILWLPAVAGTLYLMGVIWVLIFKNRIAKGTSGNAEARKRRFSLKRTSTSMLWLSTAAAFASALALTQLGSALQLTTSSLNTPVTIIQGHVQQGLHWAIFGLSVLFTLGISIISDRAAPSTAGPTTTTKQFGNGFASGGIVGNGYVNGGL